MVKMDDRFWRRDTDDLSKTLNAPQASLERGVPLQIVRGFYLPQPFRLSWRLRGHREGLHRIRSGVVSS